MAVRTNDNDGSTFQFVDPANIFTQDPFSTMVWANLYSGDSNPQNRTIITVWDNPSSKSWFLKPDTVGALTLRSSISFDGAANTTLVATAGLLSLDTWFHAGIDFDGTDLHIWLNGVLEATLNDPGTIFDDGENFGIGGTSDGGNTQDVDTADVRYYDRILSAEEWLTIYTSQGHDGIVEGLLLRPLLNDRESGILVTAKNPIDAGPGQIAYGGEDGAPVPEYVENGGGLSFRRRV
jgi:hypothetical protein